MGLTTYLPAVEQPEYILRWLDGPGGGHGDQHYFTTVIFVKLRKVVFQARSLLWEQEPTEVIHKPTTRWDLVQPTIEVTYAKPAATALQDVIAHNQSTPGAFHWVY
jgi:hypothetical protein